MFEVDEAAKIITESVDPEANIIFGATIREDYEGELKITVVAAGFDESSNQEFTNSRTTNSSKPNPFGKRQVTDSRISNTQINNNPMSRPTSS
jgi:cell division protein FtsZ